MKSRLIEITAWLALIVFCIATMQGSIVYGFLSLLVMILLYVIFHNFIERWMYRIELDSYKNKTKNIYVRSLNKDDKEVFLRAEHHREKLIESGNKMNLSVFELYFRDEKNANENWEEFEFRSDEFEKEDNLKMNVKFSKQDRDWYKKHYLNQNGL